MLNYEPAEKFQWFESIESNLFELIHKIVAKMVQRDQDTIKHTAAGV